MNFAANRWFVAVALLLSTSAAHAQGFNPIDFFVGRTAGVGTLKVPLQSPKRITVQSKGMRQADGVLLLRQIIDEPGKAARTRYWRFREIGPSRFEGTLTDAVGPVRIDVESNAVRIRYRDKDNLHFDQRLTPAGPGTLSNRMRVKRFGIIVARFEETIRKLD